MKNNHSNQTPKKNKKIGLFRLPKWLLLIALLLLVAGVLGMVYLVNNRDGGSRNVETEVVDKEFEAALADATPATTLEEGQKEVATLKSESEGLTGEPLAKNQKALALALMMISQLDEALAVNAQAITIATGLGNQELLKELEHQKEDIVISKESLEFWGGTNHE